MAKKKATEKSKRVYLSAEEQKLINEIRDTGVIPDQYLVKSDTSFQKLKERYKESDRRYKQVLSDLEEKQSTIDHLLQLQQKPSGKPLANKIKAKPNGRVGNATAVIVASDWHVEENVDPSTVNDKNEYNLKIAEKRAGTFFRKALWLTELVRGGIQINDMVFAILGDMITGYIHEELQEDNNLSPTEASLFVQDLLCSGIDYLLKEGNFKNLIIPCCIGNHGRTTMKRRVATSYKNSYEWLMYKNMEKVYRKNSKVHFIVQNGYHTYVPLYGKFKLRFHHGDALRYAGGVGGIAIPANKAVSQWNKTEKAYLDVFGHFHTQMMDCGPFVSNGCFTEDMMVTMNNGTKKKIKEVEIGEKVLCIDGKVNKVVNRLTRPHKDRLINILWQGLFSKIECTPNHEFWAIKKNQINQIIQTKTIKKKTQYKETDNFISPSWIPAEFLSEGDFIHMPYNKKIKDDSDFSKDFCKMLGFYLAEGSITRYKSGTLSQTDFSFHINEKEYADFVYNQLEEKYSIQARKTERKNKTTRHVIFNNKDVAKKIYKLCGKGSKTKKLCDKLMFLPPEKQKQILYGWIMGDGHLTRKFGKKGRFRLVSATSISFDLINQMMQIALRCGFEPTLYSQDNGGPRKNRSYTLHFKKKDAEKIAEECDFKYMVDFSNYRETNIGIIKHNDEIFIPIKSIWSENFDDDVYDLEVENNHSYVINGIGVHNSLIGWNAFAISIKASYEDPQQSFFVIDQENGKICDWPIFLK